MRFNSESPSLQIRPRTFNLSVRYWELNFGPIIAFLPYGRYVCLLATNHQPLLVKNLLLEHGRHLQHTVEDPHDQQLTRTTKRRVRVCLPKVTAAQTTTQLFNNNIASH